MTVQTSTGWSKIHLKPRFRATGNRKSELCKASVDTRSLRAVFLKFFSFFVFHLLIRGEYQNTCCWHCNQINDYDLFCDIIKTSIKERLAQGASRTSWIRLLQEKTFIIIILQVQFFGAQLARKR